MAAGATYTPIQTTTVSGTSTNNVTFSSIPSTYTDLVLSINNGGTSVAQGYAFQFNGDTGTNYSFTTFWSPSTGSTPGAFRTTNTTSISQFSGLAGNTSTIVLAANINIMNYSNTTTYKTLLQRSQSEQTTQVLVGLWRNTSAITSINLFMGSGNIQSGSTFTLYGIASA